MTPEENNILLDLSESKFEAFIPIWEAYKLIKDKDELLEELKLLIFQQSNRMSPSSQPNNNFSSNEDKPAPLRIETGYKFGAIEEPNPSQSQG